MPSRSRSRSRNHGHRAFLTKMNGDNMSYELPLTVLQLKHELPTLADDFMYRIMNGTNVLKDSQRLEDMDYHLTVATVKIEWASWCPKSWNGVVPKDARDRSGNLPQSTQEAGRSIYWCMRSCRVDVESYGDTDMMDGRLEMATDYVIESGWDYWKCCKLPLYTSFSDPR